MKWISALLILPAMCFSQSPTTTPSSTSTATATRTSTATITPTFTVTPTPTEEVRAWTAPVAAYVQGVRVVLRSMQASPGGQVTRDGTGVVVLIGSDGTVLQESSIELENGPNNPSVDRVRTDLGLTAGQMGSRSLAAVYLMWLRMKAEQRLLPGGTMTPIPTAAPTATPTP